VVRLYAALTALGALSWFVLMLYCYPGAHRVVFGLQRRYDLLATLLLALAFNRLGYSVARFSFWDPVSLSTSELVTRSIMNVFAILCVFMSIAILRHYRRYEGSL
jgi:hypothetical protein